MPMRATPQVHENVVAVEVAVFLVQVIGIQPHQFRADRNPSRRPGFRASPVVIDSRTHHQLPLGGGDVLVPKPECLTDPDAGLMQDRKQESVPKMLARIQDRL